MALRRCTCQSKPLREFYEEFLEPSTADLWQKAATRMLQLLSLLEPQLGDVEVWGLTSLANLSLRRQDDWQAPGYVSIRPWSDWIEVHYYEVRGDRAAQKGICLGRADNAEDAKGMVLTSMVRSGAWPEMDQSRSYPG
jgi:hypothetical protein